MKSIAAVLRDHLDSEVTALITCWEIERVDGTVLRFTDSDEDVEHDGAVYQSIGAYKRTAIENTATLSVDNLDVIGAANELSLPETELRAGLYDNAEVKVFTKSWLGTVNGEVKMRRGFFGKVQMFRNGTFEVELRGILQRLAYTYTNSFTASCLHDLGDGIGDNPKPRGCKVPIKPKTVERSTEYTLGDVVRAADTGTVSGEVNKLAIGDAGFESAGANGISSSRYWYNSGAVDLVPVSTSAKSGTYSVRGGDGSGALAQDVDLISATGVSAASIDAGDCYLSFYGWRRDDGDSGRLRAQFLDEDMALLSEWDTGFEDVGTTWVLRGTADSAIPANARFVRILFEVQVDGANPANAYLDAVYGWVVDTSQSTVLTEAYGNLYWECTTAGTTAASAPTFSGPAGNTVTDGTVVWTAKEAWTRAGTVTASEGPRIFYADITESRAVDGWFQGGLVTFESGENRGASMEVKTWDQSTGKIELFLSLPHQVDAGDLFSIYPGCDKSRIGCAVIFDQIEDFFGAPDIPGQDELFRYPDSKS